MCDLVTATLVMSAIGTGVQAFGKVQQGKAAQQQADYQAQVSRNNAAIAEQNAQDALARGAAEEQELRRRISQVKSSQRAAVGASGVLVDSGSALDMLGDTAMLGELDVLTLRGNTEREARSYRVQGGNFNAEAGLYSAQGANARQAGYTGAAGTILGGGSDFASKWYRFDKEGW